MAQLDLPIVKNKNKYKHKDIHKYSFHGVKFRTIPKSSKPKAASWIRRYFKPVFQLCSFSCNERSIFCQKKKERNCLAGACGSGRKMFKRDGRVVLVISYSSFFSPCLLLTTCKLHIVWGFMVPVVFTKVGIYVTRSLLGP